MDPGSHSEIIDTAVNLYRHLSEVGSGVPNKHIVSAFGKSVDLARMNFFNSLNSQISELEKIELLEEIHSFRKSLNSKSPSSLQIATYVFYSHRGPYGSDGPSKLLDLIFEIADGYEAAAEQKQFANQAAKKAAEQKRWTVEQRNFAQDCFSIVDNTSHLFCFFDQRLQHQLYTIKNESHRGDPSYDEILLLSPNSDGKHPDDISSTELIENLSRAGARAISLSLLINGEASDETVASIKEFDDRLLNKLHYQGINTTARDMRNLLSNLGWGPENYVRDKRIVKRARKLVENHPVVKFWGWGGIGKSALAFKLLKDFSDENIQTQGESPSGEYFEHFLGMSSKIGSDQGELDVRDPGRLKTVDATTSAFISLLDDTDDDGRSLHERLRGSARRIFKKIVKMFDPRTDFDDDQLRELALKYLTNERILLVLDNLEDLSDPNVPPDPSQSQKDEFASVSREYEKVKQLINDLENLGVRNVKSRIIVTTRIHTEAEGLGREMEVPRLDQNESMELFTKVVDNELSSPDITTQERKKFFQSRSEITKKKKKLTNIFENWSVTSGNEGTHPLIVISAAHKVTTYQSVEDCLNDWMKGNNANKQEILVYCCKKLLGSMKPDHLEVVQKIVKNRDIIGKRFFTFEDLERYEVFPSTNYAENIRIINQFVGWNWVRKTTERTNTFYHWLPEIVESIHTSLNIDSSQIFGTEWKGSDVFALSHPKEISETEERRISDDAKLLDTWEKWLETDPDLTKHLGHTPPWKESQKHRDILYKVHSSSKKITVDSDLIGDEQLSKIWDLCKKTIGLFNSFHAKHMENIEANKIIVENLEGIWRIYVKSSINILSRIDDDTHPQYTGRKYICLALASIINKFHESRSLHEYMIDSDATTLGISSARPADRVVRSDLTISTFELLKFATDTYSQDGFVSNEDDVDNLTNWIELQAAILEPVPADHRTDSLKVIPQLSSAYRDWLRIYKESEALISNSPEIRDRLRGCAFWISLRLYMSLKSTDGKRYIGADRWREQEFLLAGIRAAKNLSPFLVESHYGRAIRKDEIKNRWIWDDEEICSHISKGYGVSSGALVHVDLREGRNWAEYRSKHVKPPVSIRCPLKSYNLPGIYLAKVISSKPKDNLIHCEVLFGEDGYLTKVPDSQIRIKLNQLLVLLETNWKTEAHTEAKLLAEINKIFPDTSELRWLGGEMSSNIIKTVVEYSKRTGNAPTIEKNGGYVGFSVTNWPPSKPKYIVTHGDDAWHVIFGGKKGESLAMPADPGVLARIILEFEVVRDEHSSAAKMQPITYAQLASELFQSVKEQAAVDIPNTKSAQSLGAQAHSLQERILAMRNKKVFTQASKHSKDDVVEWGKLPKDLLQGIKSACINIQTHKRDRKYFPCPSNLEQIIEDYFDDVTKELL